MTNPPSPTPKQITSIYTELVLGRLTANAIEAEDTLKGVREALFHCSNFTFLPGQRETLNKRLLNVLDAFMKARTALLNLDKTCAAIAAPSLFPEHPANAYIF